MKRRDGAHHDHSLETVTDVAVRRLSAAAGDGRATIGWDYPGKTLLEVRILRSTQAAAGPEDFGAVAAGVTAPNGTGGAAGAAGRAVLVYQDVTGSFRDAGLENGRAYVYSVFARHPGGEWVRWDDLELTPRAATAPGDGEPPSHADVPGGVRPGGGAGRARPQAAALGAFALTLLLLLTLAFGAALPALGEDGTQGEGQGGDAKAAAGEAQATAWDIALSDPVVVDVLGDQLPTSSAADVVLWAPEGDPAGATVYLLWPDEPGTEIDAELPVVRRRDPDAEPTAPFDVTTRRVRATEVTGLRVLVDLGEERVLEVYPWDEHAVFTLREDTTAPFSWLPWFTSNAWVLLPVFGGLTLYLGIRAYLRSRAWRRRLPSMSRHDRQLLGRMLVAALMMVAVVIMAVAIWRAVSAPILDPDRLVGGDLSTWPLVLFPPLLYLAAVGLELSGASHRVAWGLVAVLAGVSCIYVLVAMRETAITNVTLLDYILLGCLTLVAIPRAFAPGKLGWSRSMGRAGSSV